MEPNPTEQAFAVVTGVVSYICKKLGAAADEHICREQLFVRAEAEINRGLSVEKATTYLSSVLIWTVQEKLEDQIISVKRIREELIRTSKQVIDGEGSWDNKNTSEQTEGNTENLPGTCRLEASGTESIIDNSDVEVNPKAPQTPPVLDEDDDDIRVLTPVPRSPAPLIDITGDSSPSSSSISISSVKETMKTLGDEEESTVDTMDTVDMDDSEKSGYTGKNIETLLKASKVLDNGKGNDSDSEEELIGACALETNTGNSDMPVEPQAVLVEPNPNGMVENYSHEQGQEIQKEEVLNEPSVRPKLTNGVVLGQQSDNLREMGDSLWEEAQYVCNLLPYFQLADVHQSMMDNYYHPDRKAYVLELYINLAVDKDEYIPDTVFQGLRAARKRTHNSATELPVVDNKKIKLNNPFDDENVNHQPYQNAMRGFNDGTIPSTSGANTGSIDASARLPVVDLNTNKPNDLHVENNGPKNELNAERDQWCKEKFERVRAVLCDVNEFLLRNEINLCHTDADVELLVERWLMNPENFKQHDTLQPSNNQVPVIQTAQPGASAFHGVGRNDDSEKTSLQIKQDDGSENSTPGTSGENRTGEGDESGSADLEDQISSQVARLREMFVDADPDFLQEKCTEINGDPEKFQLLAEELAELVMKNQNYPKIEEYYKRQKRLEIKKKFIEGMTVEEFLEYFDDPDKVFTDTSTQMSKTYVENAKAQLMRDLPFHLQKDIVSEHKKHNYHYLPTLRALQENGKIGRRKTKRGSQLKESDLDDVFIKEMCYVRMQSDIKEYLWKKEEDKKQALLAAKENNELQECQICYNDEVLEEDMDFCSAPDSKHKFCTSCIRRFVEEEIGQGRTSYHCLADGCKAEFSLSTLKKLMKPSIFSSMLSRKQQEEIAAAGIEDLVSCPFCNFQTIMPNKEDKVFKCLNPECMKDSCRLCKEPNHVPLRCEEVEKQNQKDTRTFLEDKMTEAMVRECWKCKKRFIKEDGCNKMSCSCGAKMCYICKKPIKGYEHFEDKTVPTDPSKCPLWSNSEKIHAEEVRDAAEKLKQDLDPALKLVHNPLNDLPQVPKHLNKQRNPGQHQIHLHHHHHRHDHHHHHHPPPAHQNNHFFYPDGHPPYPPRPVNPPPIPPRPNNFMPYMWDMRRNNPPPPAHQPLQPQMIRGGERHLPRDFPMLPIQPHIPMRTREDLIAQFNEFNEVMQNVRMANARFEFQGEGAQRMQQE